MRPRLLTIRNFVLLIAITGLFSGLVFWLKSGMPLPGGSVPSTAGNIAYISTSEDGVSHLVMARGDDGSSVVSLADGVVPEGGLAWKPDGSLVAFAGVSGTDRNPQIHEVDAQAGAKVVPLTHTSSSKSAPVFGSDARVYFLADGKLLATTTEGTNTDQVFPSSDALKSLAGTDEQPGILSMGGIARALPSPVGSNIAVVLKTEHGEALLLYEAETKYCVMIGVAERILPAFASDGRLAAVFTNGSPLSEPRPLFNADFLKAGATVSKDAIDIVPPAGSSAAVVFDTAGAVQSVLPLPFAPVAAAVSPDGSRIAMALDKPGNIGKGKTIQGLLLGGLKGEPGTRAFSGPVSDVSFSPDGKQVAFVSGSSVYMVSSEAGGTPRVLSTGPGRAGAPVWSPALPRH